MNLFERPFGLATAIGMGVVVAKFLEGRQNRAGPEGGKGNGGYDGLSVLNRRVALVFSLFPAQGTSGYGLGLKLNLVEEKGDTPAFSVAVISKIAEEPVRAGGPDIIGYNRFSEVIYKFVLSKKISDRTHVHFGYDSFSGSIIDENDNRATWDSLGYYFGWDSIWGNFKPMIDWWFYQPGGVHKVSYTLRGPLDWWLQPQIGSLAIRGNGLDDNVILYGFYLP